MKKLLSLSLLAACCALPFTASAAPRTEYIERVETCEAILQEFMANPETAIPAEILKIARGIVIVNQVRAGLVIGVKDGWGVIMVRRPDNTWSLPALLAAGEGSIGLQIGATTIESVYIFTNDETPRMLFNQRFHVGVDAKAVAGPKAASNEHTNEEILKTPVLIYQKNRGLYAGASLKAGYLARNDEANRSLYLTNYTLPEILYSNWVQPIPEVVPLMDYVHSLTN
ncbi:MAG: lipid-binding SYLF domain-containing protein [Opitutaceae bacterium]|nr:lipid-binding SYLF domain-containing protein [Opitutaceae bacterium]